MGAQVKQRIYRSVVVLASLMLLQTLPAGQPTARASATVLPIEIILSAELVVDATVVSDFVVEIDAVPHTVATLAVKSRIKGESASTISVVTAGGLTLDGRDIFVSHAPRFRVDQQVQVALARSSQHALEASLLEQEAILTPLFEVYGAERGVADLVPGEFDAHAAGVNDFSITQGLRWSSFSPPASYLVNPTGSGLNDEKVIASAQRAAQAWEDDPATFVDFDFAGPTTKGPIPGDGHNVISFAPLSSSELVARTTWFVNPDGTYEFDIVLNTEHRWSDGAVRNRYDMQSTITHELGHALGLGDLLRARASQEIMFIEAARGRVKGLGDGDRAGLRRLYPIEIPAASCDELTITVDLNTGQGSPTEGNDVILGTPGPDWIWALGGDDVICGGMGIDRIFAGDGDDLVFGGGGSDRIWGEAGHDAVYGGAGADRIRGGDGDDLIFGQGGQDFLFGEAGNDELQGNWQSDQLSGGAGNDELRGAGGKDTLYGGDGDDSLFGGLNTDYLNGGRGTDAGDGQRGRDNPVLVGVSGCEEIETKRSC